MQCWRAGRCGQAQAGVCARMTRPPTGQRLAVRQSVLVEHGRYGRLEGGQRFGARTRTLVRRRYTLLRTRRTRNGARDFLDHTGAAVCANSSFKRDFAQCRAYSSAARRTTSNPVISATCARRMNDWAAVGATRALSTVDWVVSRAGQTAGGARSTAYPCVSDSQSRIAIQIYAPTAASSSHHAGSRTSPVGFSRSLPTWTR
jgi:hypothetical protein